MRTLFCCFQWMFALGLTLAAGACSRSDPEQLLRSTVDQMQQAVLARDVSGMLEHISDDFVRETGSSQSAAAMDKMQLKRILAAAFLRNEKISLITTVREVKINGKLATARIHVLATGGAGLLPERADGWEFTTAWRQEGKDWRLYNAQWND
jgi:ketosteroid isomerase-like protein